MYYYTKLLTIILLRFSVVFPTSFRQALGDYFQLQYNHFLLHLYKFITYHHNFQQCIATLTLFLKFQPNAHPLFLPHASITSLLCYIYTIFWENLLLVAQNHLLSTVCCV